MSAPGAILLAVGTTATELPGDVVVRRSARRRRTVSAFREAGRLVVAIPARFTKAEEEHWVAEMTRRVADSERRRRPSDDDLRLRAERLAATYLPDGVRPTSIRWVTNQGRRWGSCTPGEGTIRLSHRLQGMPSWVVDYVVLHELAHLVVSGHGPQFWAIVDRYPHTARARGFLHGVVHREREGDGEPEFD